MMLYRLYGQILESDIPLPELQPLAAQSAERSFALLKTADTANPPIEWFHQWPAAQSAEEQEPWLRLGKRDGEYFLRYPGLADFVVSADGLQIRCRPVAQTPLETIRHLLLDNVLPLALSRGNKIVLHAGAVALPEAGGAVIFLGESGRGKSTLTLSFAQRGYPLLTDDCLLIEERDGKLLGFPGYPGLRVWPDIAENLFPPETPLAAFAHYSEKKRVELRQAALPYSHTPLPIRGVFFLKPPEEAARVEVSPIRPKDAFVEMHKQLFNLDINDREWAKRSFMTFGRVREWPRFAEINYPRRLSLLPAVQEAILAAMIEL